MTVLTVLLTTFTFHKNICLVSDFSSDPNTSPFLFYGHITSKSIKLNQSKFGSHLDFRLNGEKKSSKLFDKIQF